MSRFLCYGLIALITAVLFGAWIFFAPWPNPETFPVPWKPDVIIVLGGGDAARARRAIRLAAAFPETPLIVTGDGGHMESLLRADRTTRDRLMIEPDAESTWENAAFSAPLLDQLHSTRAVLVTNWFHVPRAEAVFRKQLPWIEFTTAFERAASPPSPWDRGYHRREKLAALWYLLRYRVNSF